MFRSITTIMCYGNVSSTHSNDQTTNISIGNIIKLYNCWRI